MSPLEKLRAARDLLSNPDAWTQNAPGRNTEGWAVFPGSPTAVAWCATGALEKVGGQEDAMPFLYAAIPEECREDCSPTCDCQITGYNDCVTMDHKRLLKWFDKAIKLAEKAHVPA